jgi:Domain of unknown function (DUF4272)
MLSTKEFAASHGLCVADIVPPINGYNKPYAQTAKAVAIRAIILHGVVLVGYSVEPQPIVEWFQDEEIWDYVSPQEKAFLSSNPSRKERSDARWREEAQWTMLWSIGKIEALGLPTKTCDTKRLMDEIMPALGDRIESFVSSAVLRPPAELLGEDDRTYNLHCYVHKASRANAMPEDLIYDVLYQRHYAFEWLSGDDDWDDVQPDT